MMKAGNKKATKVFRSDRDETKEQAEEVRPTIWNGTTA